MLGSFALIVFMIALCSDIVPRNLVHRLDTFSSVNNPSLKNNWALLMAQELFHIDLAKRLDNMHEHATSAEKEEER